MNYQETSRMSDDEEKNPQSHTTVDNDEEEASVSGSVNSVRKKPNAFGKKNGKHRSENTIQELAGHLFTFGNQGQQSNYLKTKRAVANFFGMTSDFGKEIFRAIKEGKEPEFQEPEEPPSKATQAQLRKYEILFKREAGCHSILEVFHLPRLVAPDASPISKEVEHPGDILRVVGLA
jgi:hypothetical protein